MFNEISKYPSQECVATPRMMTLRERFNDKKASLERQLEEVNNALALLEKNPGFEELHNAIARAGY